MNVEVPSSSSAKNFGKTVGSLIFKNGAELDPRVDLS